MPTGTKGKHPTYLDTIYTGKVFYHTYTTANSGHYQLIRLQDYSYGSNRHMIRKYKKNWEFPTNTQRWFLSINFLGTLDQDQVFRQ